MTPCSGTDYSDTWCCGNSDDCCGSDNEVHVPSNIYKVASSSSADSWTPNSASSTTTSISAGTSAQSTSSSTSPTSTSTPSDDKSSGLSEGGKAGVGVGVGVGGCAILAALVFFLNRHRKQKKMASQTPLVGQHEPPVARVYEKPAGLEDQRFEAPASVPDQRFELPGESATGVRR